MTEKPSKSQNWYFLFPTVGCTMFMILTAIAMQFYAGGTVMDPDLPGYSFSDNFFSDLGRITALSGEPNTVSSVLFFISAVGCGLMLIPFYLSLHKVFNETPDQQKWNKIGSIMATIVALGYAGIGMTPCDRYPIAHFTAVFIAFIGSFPVVIIYIWLMRQHSHYPKAYARLFAIFGIVLFAYICLMPSFADVSDITQLQVQVIGQKVVIYCEMITMAIMGIGTWRFMEEESHKKEIGMNSKA